MIIVKEPGFWTTVQDMGRMGKYHLGVPPSGAADKFSFMIGNLLVGNPVDFSGLEMTLLGGKFSFTSDYVIALTGAPMEAFLNNEPLSFWVTHKVKEGDLLQIRSCSTGVKSYLCISGGINVPNVLGSKSTYELSKIGGYNGRRLESGDRIQTNECLPGSAKQVGKLLNPEWIPTFNNFQEIRATVGYTGYLVSDPGLKSFLNTEWTVSHESNRVAYRYFGGKVSFTEQNPPFGAGKSFSNVVDFAYPIGAIMFPNEEELIVLHNDATTGGGFATIGVVISQDLDLIAQSRPQSKCHFITVTIDQAMEAREERRKLLRMIAESFK